MQDLTFLREPISEGDSKGLDSVDPRLAELAGLADRGNFEELEQRLDALFAEAIYDIRPISYYLFLAFQTRGLSVLPELFDTLYALTSVNLLAIGPERRREDHVAKRLAWLLQRIGDAIQYHETKRTEQWTKWTRDVGAQVLEATSESAGILEKHLALNLPGARSAILPFMAKIRALIESQAKEDLGTSPLGEVPLDYAPRISVPAAAVSPLLSKRPLMASRRPDNPRPDGRPDRVEIGVSHKYQDLVQKLDAFRALLQKRDFVKAAVVSDDLLNELDHFDPRAYFPELFGDFSELLSQHVGSMAEYWEQRESVTWKALAQFYRVDIRRFVGN